MREDRRNEKGKYYSLFNKSFNDIDNEVFYFIGQIKNGFDPLVFNTLDKGGCYLSFSFNIFGIIDSVVYLGKEQIDYRALVSLVGLHETYLNKILNNLSAKGNRTPVKKEISLSTIHSFILLSPISIDSDIYDGALLLLINITTLTAIAIVVRITDIILSFFPSKIINIK